MSKLLNCYGALELRDGTLLYRFANPKSIVTDNAACKMGILRASPRRCRHTSPTPRDPLGRDTKRTLAEGDSRQATSAQHLSSDMKPPFHSYDFVLEKKIQIRSARHLVPTSRVKLRDILHSMFCLVERTTKRHDQRGTALLITRDRLPSLRIFPFHLRSDPTID